MTCLYRHFSASGQLLYIGATGYLASRNSWHRHNSPWARQIARTTVVEFESREAALTAEADAIVCERPLYNIVAGYKCDKISISLRTRLFRHAMRRAKSLNLTFSGFICRLIRQDTGLT